jgi:hypothetical protein
MQFTEAADNSARGEPTKWRCVTTPLGWVESQSIARPDKLLGTRALRLAVTVLLPVVFVAR